MFSKTLLLFFIVNFASYSYGQKTKNFFRKDYKYMEKLQSFYKIHTVPQTWADAKRVCTLEGATFWHPDTDDEAKTLLSFWNSTKPNIEWIYVGLSDLLVEGVFETVDRKSITDVYNNRFRFHESLITNHPAYLMLLGKSISEVYNNWQPGQPDNFGEGQDCVYMYLKEGPGYLDDYACDKKYSFICKKTLQSLEWNYQCDMPNLDYAFNKYNNKCHKLHTAPLNWYEANAVCRLEQSSLATISNRLEADYLVTLAEYTPKPRIKGNYQRGIYHLGFYNRFNEGWRTVRGTQLKVDADIWWDNYQPEEADRDQCGAMFFNGRLININCEMQSLFICEHDLDKPILPVYTSTVISPMQSFLQPYVGGGVE